MKNEGFDSKKLLDDLKDLAAVYDYHSKTEGKPWYKWAWFVVTGARQRLVQLERVAEIALAISSYDGLKDPEFERLEQALKQAGYKTGRVGCDK